MDKLTLTAAALCVLFTLTPAHADALEDALTEIQHDWEVIRYQTPAAEREKRFETLAAKAHRVSENHPGRSEPLIWEGIVVSSVAGEKGGLGALGLELVGLDSRSGDRPALILHGGGDDFGA